MNEARPKRKLGKRYKQEKLGLSIFGKSSFPVLFSQGLAHITPYSLGV